MTTSTKKAGSHLAWWNPKTGYRIAFGTPVDQAAANAAAAGKGPLVPIRQQGPPPDEEKRTEPPPTDAPTKDRDRPERDKPPTRKTIDVVTEDDLRNDTTIKINKEDEWDDGYNRRTTIIPENDRPGPTIITGGDTGGDTGGEVTKRYRPPPVRRDDKGSKDQGDAERVRDTPTVITGGGTIVRRDDGGGTGGDVTKRDRPPPTRDKVPADKPPPPRVPPLIGDPTRDPPPITPPPVPPRLPPAIVKDRETPTRDKVPVVPPLRPPPPPLVGDPTRPEDIPGPRMDAPPPQAPPTPTFIPPAKDRDIPTRDKVPADRPPPPTLPPDTTGRGDRRDKTDTGRTVPPALPPRRYDNGGTRRDDKSGSSTTVPTMPTVDTGTRGIVPRTTIPTTIGGLSGDPYRGSRDIVRGDKGTREIDRGKTGPGIGIGGPRRDGGTVPTVTTAPTVTTGTRPITGGGLSGDPYRGSRDIIPPSKGDRTTTRGDKTGSGVPPPVASGGVRRPPAVPTISTSTAGKNRGTKGGASTTIFDKGHRVDRGGKTETLRSTAPPGTTVPQLSEGGPRVPAVVDKGTSGARRDQKTGGAPATRTPTVDTNTLGVARRPFDKGAPVGRGRGIKTGFQTIGRTPTVDTALRGLVRRPAGVTTGLGELAPRTSTPPPLIDKGLGVSLPGKMGGGPATRTQTVDTSLRPITQRPGGVVPTTPPRTYSTGGSNRADKAAGGLTDTRITPPATPGRRGTYSPVLTTSTATGGLQRRTPLIPPPQTPGVTDAPKPPIMPGGEPTIPNLGIPGISGNDRPATGVTGSLPVNPGKEKKYSEKRPMVGMFDIGR